MVFSLDSYLGDHVGCFALFGVAAASYIALKVLCSVWHGVKAFILARPLGLNANLKAMGSWAVVTGATDGIGKAYAQQLARMGLNVVLISRTLKKLQDTAQEIESQYNVKTRVVSVDFTGGIEIYDTIRTALAGLDIGVLVNNVGMSYDHPDFFDCVEDQTLQNIINCNVNSVTMVTKIVLPSMLEKKTGAIINLSSASGFIPTPMLAVYAATKAYVDFFSRALATEYKSKGIIVQCVLPYFVTTKLSKLRHASMMVPSPTSYVRSAIGTIGVQARTFGCMAHAIQSWVFSCVPESIYQNIGLSQMMAVRKRALLKKQQKKE